MKLKYPKLKSCDQNPNISFTMADRRHIVKRRVLQYGVRKTDSEFVCFSEILHNPTIITVMPQCQRLKI